MKNILVLSVALFVSSLMSCESCNQTNNVADAQVVDAQTECPMDRVLEKDNINLTLPMTWGEEPNSRKTVLLVAIEPKLESLLVLTKEPYTGTFDQFAIDSIRGLRSGDAGLVGTSSVELNGSPFVLAETTKDGLTMLEWITVKDGFGYGLSCGGPEVNSDKHVEACQKIATSLTIN